MKLSVSLSWASIAISAGGATSQQFVDSNQPQQLRQLSRAKDITSNVHSEIFANGRETYWDDYAQAWRLLGFYIDCDERGNDAQQQQDQEEGDDQQQSSDCQRYLLWAAYVDPGYSGNARQEYQFYDRVNHKWDRKSCGRGKRCVPMDCHSSSSQNFQLLGYFKQADYLDFFQQLADAGDCVWKDSTYKWMRPFLQQRSWPEACTGTGFIDSKTGRQLYYDLKPSLYGTLQLGVYLDSSCQDEFSSGTTSVEELMKEVYCSSNASSDICLSGRSNYYEAWQAVEIADQYRGQQKGDYEYLQQQVAGNVWQLASSMEEFNEDLTDFQQCQPCVLYDRTNVVNGYGYEKNSDGMRYNFTLTANDDQQQQDMFQCPADLSSGNDQYVINQCMLFHEYTQIKTATWNDVEMAMNQGSIASQPAPGRKGGGLVSTLYTPRGNGIEESARDQILVLVNWGVLIVASLLFGSSFFRYQSARQEHDQMVLQEPLIPSEAAVAS